MRKLLRIIENVLFIMLLAGLCWTIYSIHVNKTVSFFDYHFLRILSNSMEPTLDVNTCIIVKEVEEDELEVGDIITFRSRETEIYGNYNTHRIYEIIIDEETGEREYITKGDLFEYPDRLHLKYDDIIGKYQRNIPYSNKISILVEKLSNNKIYFVVVIFPLVLCLLSYIYQLIHILFFGCNDENNGKEVEGDETLHKS
ncbi:MAG: signal peptidase I [Lachnospiraceae bacterium]|nr:signal peptidase I [Lachnospiraceae bacterium]